MTSAWVKKLQLRIAEANEKMKLIDEQSTKTIKDVFLPRLQNQIQSNTSNTVKYCDPAIDRNISVVSDMNINVDKVIDSNISDSYDNRDIDKDCINDHNIDEKYIDYSSDCSDIDEASDCSSDDINDTSDAYGSNSSDDINIDGRGNDDDIDSLSFNSTGIRKMNKSLQSNNSMKKFIYDYKLMSFLVSIKAE
jgi:hypothetical protein